ncbi:MAG: cyclic nucleotide-binding domain-containing protein, partial [Nocardioidaceae bacterium]
LGVLVIRATSLGRSFVGGVVLWGVPLLVVAVWPTAGVAYLAMLLIGFGNAFEDASMFTLLPRYAGARLAGRTLGALELLVVIGVGAGSVSAPWLLHLLGARRAFGFIGAAILVLALLYAARFARVDRDLPRPGPQLELMRRLPMFAPLPLMIVEGLASVLEPQEYAAGDVVMRQGDPGNRFHIVEGGTADVVVNGIPKAGVGPGDCFGEIALLHDGPRTATIIAQTRLRTLTLDRDAFLCAVTGNQIASSSATTLASERLASDPPGHP